MGHNLTKCVLREGVFFAIVRPEKMVPGGVSKCVLRSIKEKIITVASRTSAFLCNRGGSDPFYLPDSTGPPNPEI